MTTAKQEFRKWYSACRACVRDQKLAGQSVHAIRFHASSMGLEVRLGGAWSDNNFGLERLDPKRPCGKLDDPNAMWHGEFNHLMATRKRYGMGLAGLGVVWYGLELDYLKGQRLAGSSVLPA